jgi:acyl-CoA dehydrogenase family protein 9
MEEVVEQSFMKALFFGVIAEDVVLPFPEISPPERERLVGLIGQVGAVLDGLDPSEVDRSGVIPSAVLDQLGALGVLGATTPADYGGLGLSTMAHCRLIAAIATRDSSLALTLVVHEALGARAISLFGTPEQTGRYLPRLARGELIAAFALTERAAGSDAQGLRTTATPDASGGYRLNGEKVWVTNATQAGLFVVFARTTPPDRGDKPRLTAFLVEAGEGVRLGARVATLGVRGAQIAPVELVDVHVPADRVLGEPGKGMKVAMAAINDARVVLAAAAVGQTRALVDASLGRLTSRRSFGRPIGQFPLQADKVASILADAFAAESMAFLTAGLCDRRVDDTSLESAITRLEAVETLERVASRSFEISASEAFETGHLAERLLRDVRAGYCFDGTHDILRCFIALSGMKEPGRKIQEVERGMRDPVKGFGLLRDFAVRKMREALRRDRFTRVHALLAPQTSEVEQAVEAFCQAVDRALKEHGVEIVEMQHAQRRIADAASALYSSIACISRTDLTIERRGPAGAARELELTRLVVRRAMAVVRESLGGFDENDDELRGSIAARAYADGRYPFDVI